MKRRWVIGAWIALIIMLALVVGPALAHSHATVGDYELEIGFLVEPAYQGEPNGLELQVTNTKTGEKINGLETSLQVEIIYGSSKKMLKLQPAEEEGAYMATVLPTAAGDYTWHLFGKIEDTPVDVSMTSGPESFSPVQPKSVVSFPGTEPAGNELSGQAQLGLVAGVIGAVLGLAGLVFGLMGFQAARRK